MKLKCSICCHPALAVINQSLHEGVSRGRLVALSTPWGVSCLVPNLLLTDANNAPASPWPALKLSRSLAKNLSQIAVKIPIMKWNTNAPNRCQLKIITLAVELSEKLALEKDPRIEKKWK